MPEKVRLDLLLVERALAKSRHEAQGLILAGKVLVDNSPSTKAGQLVRDDCELRLRGVTERFVSRGGEKLAAALSHFAIHVAGRVALDVGASTGGFTDCLLQAGASKVYAVDVGYNQLDLKLRNDARVVVHERLNAKQLPDFPEKPDLAVVDLSFIGLVKVLEPILHAVKRPADLVLLIKPQFELEPKFISKGGVVTSESDRQLAIQKVERRAEELGLIAKGVIASPLVGAKMGNQEYLAYFQAF